MQSVRRLSITITAASASDGNETSARMQTLSFGILQKPLATLDTLDCDRNMREVCEVITKASARAKCSG